MTSHVSKVTKQVHHRKPNHDQHKNNIELESTHQSGRYNLRYGQQAERALWYLAVANHLMLFVSAQTFFISLICCTIPPLHIATGTLLATTVSLTIGIMAARFALKKINQSYEAQQVHNEQPANSQRQMKPHSNDAHTYLGLIFGRTKPVSNKLWSEDHEQSSEVPEVLQGCRL